MSTASEKAKMPKGTHSVLARRSVHNANRNLLEIVKEGDSVLDMGCGSGAITHGIVDLVGKTGSVKGIDPSEHLIKLAADTYSNIPNLSFELADINTYTTTKPFDVVSAARVLQWLANPEEVLGKMYNLLKDNGILTILDYNHTIIEWTPAVPQSMQAFYNAFLKWRQDSGMDNAIADHLPAMFEKLGLKNITVEDLSERSQTGANEFIEEISIWKKVAETRGKQLVEDGYIGESERLKAIEEYDEWMQQKAQSMKMHLSAVTGQK